VSAFRAGQLTRELEGKHDSGTLLEVRLETGRPIWCWQYLASYTYEGFMERTPSERANRRMLDSLAARVEQAFRQLARKVIEPPPRPPGPSSTTRRSGSPPSLRLYPSRDGMHLSSLVVVWFSGRQHPVIGEEALAAMGRLDWNRLAWTTRRNTGGGRLPAGYTGQSNARFGDGFFRLARPGHWRLG